MIQSFFLRCARVAGILLLGLPFLVAAQNEPVLQWVNGLGQNAHDQLNATTNFTTSYKTNNDVHITLLAGSLNSIFLENFSPAGPNNNPSYLTNFVGLTGNLTGDNTKGDMRMLETSLAAISVILQFDFSVPLTSQDRILLADADSNESYIIEAYHNGQPVSLVSWPVNFYTGETGQLPDTNWPSWTPTTTNGTLQASIPGNLVEPLTVLTPGQTVERIVLKKLPVGAGSLSIQFLTTPAPSLQIQRNGTNFVISWPDTYANYSLYRRTNLVTGNNWTLVPASPVPAGGRLIITNFAPPAAAFYRLQYP